MNNEDEQTYWAGHKPIYVTQASRAEQMDHALGKARMDEGNEKESKAEPDNIHGM